ncbi:thiaminase II [Clostridium sartagoforme]|uniref:Aminopyrimidine aminohydrolase n=1 Tax=Clostridium sartagoforme TaxID=84031 RepID=A0A4S2DJM9_9CLOT|nr:thiaminase II [Clostridium sartagoforme]TGY41852.1 thiaminase II [Clostridium sartagoforme]
MKFTDILFEDVREIWGKYLEHPFVKEIGEGTLDKEKFKNYLVQDYLYLKEYAKVFAMGLVKAESLSDMNLYYGSIKGILEDETEVHTNYLKYFGIDQNKVFDNRKEMTTESYTSYMLGIGLKGDLKEIAMTILPCAWSYQFIGRSLYEKHKDTLDNNFYKPWIEEYSSVEFEEGSEVWKNHINDLCKDISEKEAGNLRDIFMKSSLYEMDFWDMAYGK